MPARCGPGQGRCAVRPAGPWPFPRGPGVLLVGTHGGELTAHGGRGPAWESGCVVRVGSGRASRPPRLLVSEASRGQGRPGRPGTETPRLRVQPRSSKATFRGLAPALRLLAPQRRGCVDRAVRQVEGAWPRLSRLCSALRQATGVSGTRPSDRKLSDVCQRPLLGGTCSAGSGPSRDGCSRDSRHLPWTPRPSFQSGFGVPSAEAVAAAFGSGLCL